MTTKTQMVEAMVKTEVKTAKQKQKQSDGSSPGSTPAPQKTHAPLHYRLSLRGSHQLVVESLSKQLLFSAEVYAPGPTTSLLSALLALGLQQMSRFSDSTHTRSRFDLDVEYDVRDKVHLRCDLNVAPDATPRGFNSFYDWEQFLKSQNVSQPETQAAMQRALKSLMGAEPDA